MLEKTMDKLTLNTEIVSMRHATRRSKVHIISKLVRETKKLRNKKGTEEQRKKYDRKADRLAEEVLIIKKLKDDDISKFALTNTRPAEEIISDATISLDTRSLARLANHQHLKLRVNEFRTKYPSWAETIPQLLPHLGAKRKKKGKEKTKKKSEAPDNTVIQNNDSNDVISNSNKENNSILDENAEDANCEKKPKKRKASKLNETEQDGKRKEEPKVQRHSGIGEVKRFTELLKQEQSVSNDSNDDDDDDDDVDDGQDSEVPVAPEAPKTDPFFLLGDEDEVSDNDDTPVQESKARKPIDNSWGKSKPVGPNRRQRRQQLHGSKPVSFKSFQHKVTKGFAPRETQQASIRGKKQEQHAAPQGNDTAVHPSWEAKRKLKEQQQAIFAFQGKKIKFDNE